MSIEIYDSEVNYVVAMLCAKAMWKRSVFSVNLMKRKRIGSDQIKIQHAGDSRA